jgi:hypothetical protein
MKLIRCLFSLMVLLSAMGMANAATFLLDDSQSQVLDPQVSLQWRSISPAKGDHQVMGQTRVHIKLDTRNWVGQQVRIFMALPAQPSSTVQANWTVQNQTLQAGQLISGQRSLVWAGVVRQPMLDDVMTVVVQTDGRFLAAVQQLRFYFEVDVP